MGRRSSTEHRQAEMTEYFEPGDLELSEIAVACIESGKAGLLMDAGAIPLEFFDLSSRAAGELLHQLGKYGIRMAGVIPRPEDHSAAFQDFVREANRGRSVRFFAHRSEAEAWLWRDPTGSPAGVLERPTFLAELEPVDTRPLFPDLHRALVKLLGGLSVEDWSRPTVAGRWTVRDVVSHLLDGQMRRLSIQRDDHSVPPGRDLSSHAALVEHLNELNASWMDAMARTSPRLLLDLIDLVGPQYASFVGSLDPHGPALFPVAWAGEAESSNWFDIGRDYTELWHHQAQVRLAVGAELLEEPRWLRPIYQLSVRALARALSRHVGGDATAVVLRIEGEAGGVWSAVLRSGVWSVLSGAADEAEATVTVAASDAWRIFFNAVPASEASGWVRAEGDPALVQAVLDVRSVMV